MTTTRDKMIAGAADLMSRLGVNATSMRDVVRHTATPRGSIGHHFPDGKRQLIAFKLRESDVSDHGATVALADLNDIPVPGEHVLQRVFDLTNAEVRLAQGVARGDSLEEVAAGLGIKISTARTQLASIFAKTQTRRQAKLVALLGRLAQLGA